jgi:hypothetical protein
MAGALAGDRFAVELTAKADCEIANVDDLLNFAACFGRYLAGLPRDERCEVFLLLAKRVPYSSYKLTTHWRRRVAPSGKHRGRPFDHRVYLLCRGASKLGQRAAVDR